jgi:GR25 family glycosyltransferase involved in LPS biosynthesis
MCIKGLSKLYIIVDKRYEESRHDNVIKQLNYYNITDYEIVTCIWGTEITEEIKNEYIKSDYSMRFHGRNMIDKPLSNGEISLFLNHIKCLESIKMNFNNGNFLILESDALFTENFKVELQKIIENSSCIRDWDIINIGAGQQKYMKSLGYPKTKEITVNDTKFYKENINRCTEALIWNYSSVNKFLTYFNMKKDIDGPIDTKLDIFSSTGNFNIYWCNPEIVYQGSILNVYDSHLR